MPAAETTVNVQGEGCLQQPSSPHSGPTTCSIAHCALCFATTYRTRNVLWFELVRALCDCRVRPTCHRRRLVLPRGASRSYRRPPSRFTGQNATCPQRRTLPTIVLQKRAETYAFGPRHCPYLRKPASTPGSTACAALSCSTPCHPKRRHAAFREAHALQAIAVTGFTRPTLWRGVRSDVGREPTLRATPRTTISPSARPRWFSLGPAPTASASSPRSRRTWTARCARGVKPLLSLSRLPDQDRQEFNEMDSQATRPGCFNSRRDRILDVALQYRSSSQSTRCSTESVARCWSSLPTVAPEAQRNILVVGGSPEWFQVAGTRHPVKQGSFPLTFELSEGNPTAQQSRACGCHRIWSLLTPFREQKRSGTR